MDREDPSGAPGDKKGGHPEEGGDTLLEGGARPQGSTPVWAGVADGLSWLSS